MKHPKRLLAFLLALAMVLTLTMPAFADDDNSTVTIILEDENMPAGASVTITSPAEYTIPYGKSFTLHAEVTAPTGMDVSYQWDGYYWYTSYEIEHATGPELTVLPGEPHYPRRDGNKDDLFFRMGYQLTVVFTEEGADSIVVTSPRSYVQMALSYIDKTPYQMVVPYGSDIIINEQMDLPPEVEVSYEWFATGEKIEGVTGQVLSLSPGDAYYPKERSSVDFLNRFLSAYQSYGYIATFTIRNEKGDVVETFEKRPFFSYSVSIEPERKLNPIEQMLFEVFLMPIITTLSWPALMTVSTIAWVFPIILLPIILPLSIVAAPFIGISVFFNNLFTNISNWLP